MKTLTIAITLTAAALTGASLGHVIRPADRAKAVPQAVNPKQAGPAIGSLDFGPPFAYAIYDNHTCVQWPRTVRSNAVDPLTGLHNTEFDSYDAISLPGFKIGDPIPGWSMTTPCKNGKW